MPPSATSSPFPTLNFPTSALYLGDNLDFMRGMNSETVSLIATDPPFNKGVKAFKAKDGTAADGQSFTDKWNWQNSAPFLPQNAPKQPQRRPKACEALGVKGAK